MERHKAWRWPLLAGVGFAAAAVPAFAQSPAGPSGGDAGGDIVVTAQKRSQTLVEVPISVSVLPAQTLERQAIQEIRQLVQISPSVTFSEGSGNRGASFNIRGISSTAQEGGIQPSAALVIDGVPIARQGEFLSNFVDIAQVEVLAGPQGTLFGKNATAGVINIRTVDPGPRLAASGQVDVTTDAETVLRATLNAPLSPAVRLRLNGFYDNQPGIIHNVGTGVDPGGARTYALAGKLAVDLGGDLDFLLAADYRHRRDSYGAQIVLVPVSGAQGVLQAQIMGVPLGRGVDVVNQDSPTLNMARGWSTSGRLTWRASSRLSLVSITAYRDYRSDSLIDLDSGPTGYNLGRGFSPNPLNYPIGGINRGFPRVPFDTHYYSQELRANYRTDAIDLIVGGFYQHYRENFTGSSTFFRSGLFIDSGVETYRYRNDSGALFADATLKLFGPVKAFGGLRYSRETVGANYVRTPFNNALASFNPATGVNAAAPVATYAYDAKRTDGNLSGRAGLQYAPSARTNYYLSYNRGFKGAAMDTSSGWNPASRIFADPEIATSYEIGTRQRVLDGKLFFALALYSQTVKNIQQTTTTPGTISAQLQNAGDIRSRGAEFQASWKATRELILSASSAYTDAKYRGSGVVGCNVSQRAGLQGGCTIDGNGDGIPESQAIAGHPAKETPKIVYNLAVDYEHAFPSGRRVFGRIGYVWIDRIQYQLINDPLTIEPGHGLLDASIGIDLSSALRVMVFGKNLTNQFYYGNLGQTDVVIGRAWGRVARDAKRYGGVSVRASF